MPNAPEHITSTAPAKIYLDLGDCAHLITADETFADFAGEVTWSEDNATGCGILYARADLVPAPAPSGAAPALPSHSDLAHRLSVIAHTLSYNEGGREACAKHDLSQLVASLGGVGEPAASEAAKPASLAPLAVGERAELNQLRLLAGKQSCIPKVQELLGPMSLWSAAGLKEHIEREVAAALASREASPAAPLRDVVEVCPECDIAGCRHIRARAAALASPQVAPAPEPAFYVDPSIIDPTTGKVADDIKTSLTWSKKLQHRWTAPVYLAAPVQVAPAPEPAFYVNPKIIDPATGKIGNHVKSSLTWSEKSLHNWTTPVYLAAPLPTPAAADDARDAARSQHDADSRELRSLCIARDEARRERDLLKVDVAALEASVGNLSRLVDELRPGHERYLYLRERPVDTIDTGGVFAGLVPDNVVVNGEDLDRAVDAAMSASTPAAKPAEPTQGDASHE